jgi:hypothetical protein
MADTRRLPPPGFGRAVFFCCLCPRNWNGGFGGSSKSAQISLEAGSQLVCRRLQMPRVDSDSVSPGLDESYRLSEHWPTNAGVSCSLLLSALFNFRSLGACHHYGRIELATRRSVREGCSWSNAAHASNRQTLGCEQSLRFSS